MKYIHGPQNTMSLRQSLYSNPSLICPVFTIRMFKVFREDKILPQYKITSFKKIQIFKNMWHIILLFKLLPLGDNDMAPRASAGLAENLSYAHTDHTGLLTSACNSRPEGSNASSTRYLHSWVNIYTQTHRVKILNKW